VVSVEIAFFSQPSATVPGRDTTIRRVPTA